MAKPVIVGAVLYDPKVSVIWEIIREFFEARGCPMDVVFYTNYELQNQALADGHIDIAWNSPLAWLDAQRRTGDRCRAIAMRDTDRDRVSHLVVKQDSGIESLQDLRGRTLAVGARDLPQATLIPIGMLQRPAWSPVETSRSSVSTYWSASTATTSVASERRSSRFSAARPTPPRCSI